MVANLLALFPLTASVELKILPQNEALKNNNNVIVIIQIYMNL